MDERKFRNILRIPAYSLGLPLFFGLFGQFFLNNPLRLLLTYFLFMLSGILFLFFALYFKKALIIGRYSLRSEIVENQTAIYWGFLMFFISMAVGLPSLLFGLNLISKIIQQYLSYALIIFVIIFSILSLSSYILYNKKHKK